MAFSLSKAALKQCKKFPPQKDGKEEVFKAHGKDISLHFNPFIGWHAKVNGTIVINPWGRCRFSSRKTCLAVAKRYAKRGFYPGSRSRFKLLPDGDSMIDLMEVGR